VQAWRSASPPSRRAMIGVKTLGNAGKSSTTLAPSLVSLS
jgi:hypothetical protein